MREFTKAIALLGLGLLAACAKPLPQDHADYAGMWRDANVTLLLTPDGRVEYEKKVDGATTSIKAPIKGFSGNDFEVGLGPFSTVFKVTKPPYRDGSEWKMEVDGHTLTRSDETTSIQT